MLGVFGGSFQSVILTVSCLTVSSSRNVLHPRVLLPALQPDGLGGQEPDGPLHVGQYRHTCWEAFYTQDQALTCRVG